MTSLKGRCRVHFFSSFVSCGAGVFQLTGWREFENDGFQVLHDHKERYWLAFSSRFSVRLWFCRVCVGELAELRNDLKSEKKEKKKEAVKKIIASMTVGKDVR